MKKRNFMFLLVLLIMVSLPVVVFAEGETAIDTGDTAFNIISSALVFIMTPGLAFFYGGLVRRKNVLNTMMSSFALIGLITIQWVLIGYTLAFGTDINGLFGGLDFLGFNGVGGTPNADYAATIPHGAFAVFQLMFAIITAAIITGSFAERMRFPALMLFILGWSTLVYDPLAHWVWGVGGWIRNMGALDFAGGTVVHISSGIAGLTAALVLGKRKGYKTVPMVPHNIPFVLLGTGLLWLGWFGFNAGSALSAGDIAVVAFVNTHIAAASAALSWIILDSIVHKKPTLLGALTGGVVGLVAITPGAGFVTPLASIIIGLLVSPICFFAISVVKSKLGYDDTLDAFGCHGIGGIFGAVATGVFATTTVNPGGADGLLYGNPGLVLTQLIAVVATIAFSGIVSFILLKVISLFIKLRATEAEEDDGLDVAEHGENAYPDFSSDQSIAL